jgi:hypothetical protein
MRAVEQRFIAGLRPDSSLWTSTRSRSDKPRWSEVHLAQSELDSSCGLHCLLMALMILLGLSRHEVLKLTTAKRGPLAALWKAAHEEYFEGTDVHDLMRYVQSLGVGLVAQRHLGPPATIARSVTSAVLDNQVPILRIIGSQYDHWVLVTGVERSVPARTATPADTLLVLDPGERAPRLCAYTGRIDLAARVHRRNAIQVKSRSYSYRSISGRCVNARLAGLLVLRLAQAP